MKRPNITSLIHFLLILLIVSPQTKAQAPISQQVIRDQDWIIRQQQKRIEDQKRQKKLRALKRQRELRKQRLEREKRLQKQARQTQKKCFPVHKIEIFSANLLSKKQKSDLVAPFINRCFYSDDLLEIVAKINAFYHNRNYTLAQTSTISKNLTSGILKLKVFEGKIAKITLNDDGFAQKMQRFGAFGPMKGKIFNLKDVDQGIYQMNRLRSNGAATKVSPSQKEGETDLEIINKRSLPIHASSYRDNLGNDFTGTLRSGTSLNIDNLLSINDNVNLDYSTNINDDPQVKGVKTFVGAISIPYTYNTLSYHFSRNEFRSMIQDSGVNKRLSGHSQNNAISLDRVVFDKANLSIDVNLALTTKTAASYISGLKQETSSRRLTIGDFGLSISNYFKNGVNLYVKPSYSRGLKLLNAQKDAPSSPPENPKAQFQLYRLYISASKRVTVPKINLPLILATEINSQISKDRLFGSERISIGGYQSVRGFRENFIDGDSGYYLRNKVHFNLGQLLKGFGMGNSQEGQGVASKKLASLVKFDNFYKINIEPFYDYGYIKEKASYDSGRLSGAGVTTTFSSNYFRASLTYSWAINKAALIESQEKENKMLYFEISVNCCH